MKQTRVTTKTALTIGLAQQFIYLRQMEAYHEFTNMITGDMERFIDSVIKTACEKVDTML